MTEMFKMNPHKICQKKNEITLHLKLVFTSLTFLDFTIFRLCFFIAAQTTEVVEPTGVALVGQLGQFEQI